MVKNAISGVGQQGVVHCWSSVSQPEMEIGWVAAQMGWQRHGHVGFQLELVGFKSPWTNRLSDKDDRITIWLKVLYVEGNFDDFRYTGWRVPGTRPGDKTASLNQEPEWFEIRVTRSRASRRDREVVTATWKRIAKPTKA
jgi:hypothetical protein